MVPQVMKVACSLSDALGEPARAGKLGESLST